MTRIDKRGQGSGFTRCLPQTYGENIEIDRFRNIAYNFNALLNVEKSLIKRYYSAEKA